MFLFILPPTRRRVVCGGCTCARCADRCEHSPAEQDRKRAATRHLSRANRGSIQSVAAASTVKDRRGERPGAHCGTTGCASGLSILSLANGWCIGAVAESRRSPLKFCGVRKGPLVRSIGAASSCRRYPCRPRIRIFCAERPDDRSAAGVNERKKNVLSMSLQKRLAGLKAAESAVSQQR